LKPTPIIGVIGVGVVGGAVRCYFEDAGHTVRVYDKFQCIGSPEEVDGADIVFICVPTPYTPGLGFDVSAVEESVAVLSGSKNVAIKSTVPPGTTARLQARYPQHNLFFQPEFLREKTALRDFLEPDRQLVGYCGDDLELAQKLLALLPRAPYEEVMPAIEAELVKMGTNAFLALKVTFANQVFDLCRGLGADYETVKQGLAADPRLGPSHMDVFDGGYRGYDGKCLPKDMQGLIDAADVAGVQLPLLRTTQDINNGLNPAAAELLGLLQSRV
jgi:UDPglucose 6-dehydrogenase